MSNIHLQGIACNSEKEKKHKGIKMLYAVNYTKECSQFSQHNKHFLNP